MNVKKIIKILRRTAKRKAWVTDRQSMIEEMSRGLSFLNIAITPSKVRLVVLAPNESYDAIEKVGKILENSLKSKDLDKVNEKNYYGVSI
tara:strand:+ start:493 stop:762 length:270 start_codon:yes stop_codon:yes gene_type:complete